MSNSPPEEDTMKANSAATKIQANFRGYRVRKHLKENRPPKYEENGVHDVTVPKKMSLKRQDTKNSLEEKSATKIQAGIRGFLVRKRNQVAQAAATRIQAGFRGFRTRKQLKETGGRKRVFGYWVFVKRLNELYQSFMDHQGGYGHPDDLGPAKASLHSP